MVGFIERARVLLANTAASGGAGGGGATITGAVLALVALGTPLFVVIGGLATACFILYPIIPVDAAAGAEQTLFEAARELGNRISFIEPMVKLAEQEGIVAIPFFMIAGAIMSQGQIARRLVEFANALLGALPGGLAMTTVLSCMFFAAISGSSPVTVITIGAIMLPALAAAGYPEKMRIGLVTSAGSLGIIIPPSIPMIVFAIFATNAGQRADVDDLFMAGIGPGLVLGFLLMGYCMFAGRKLPRQAFKVAELVRAFLDGIWALLFPFFILGGIYGGLFNATEASAISVLLALVIELFIHRSLRARDLPRILGETAVLMGSILIIICVAFAFAEWMSFRRIPEEIVAWLRGFDLSSWDFVLILNVLLILVGCLMDIISAIILFVPLIMPIAGELGFDPIHIGLIFIVNLEIGYLTPPLGLNLFVATTYFEKPFGLVLRSILPYLGLLVAGLMVVTYVPTISTGLVSLKNSKSFWSRTRVVTAPDGTISFDVRPNPEFLQTFPDTQLTAMTEEEIEAFDQGETGPKKGATTGDTLQDLMDSDDYQKLLDEAPDEADDEEMEEDDDFDPDALPPVDEEEPTFDEPDAGAAPVAPTAPDAGVVRPTR